MMYVFMGLNCYQDVLEVEAFPARGSKPNIELLRRYTVALLPDMMYFFWLVHHLLQTRASE
jgi:hypothetical protein